MTLKAASVALVFGTDLGNTEEVGEKIIERLAPMVASAVEMFNVREASTELLERYDFLILGIPTWEFGGIQSDWEDFEAQVLAADFEGKTVALYGLGDQIGYPDYFLDAMGWLHERVLRNGANIIGTWSTQGYDFERSAAANEDGSQFCGLAIDQDRQQALTDERVAQWVTQLAVEFEQIVPA
ncbi:MAG: flavodoxin [Pseudomonadota bacterium]